MNFGTPSVEKHWTPAVSRGSLAGFFLALAFLSASPSSFAQSPNSAATGAANVPEGFSPGWTLAAHFEGSSSSDGGVYEFGSALGYNFTRHFGVAAGVPFYFVSTPSSIKQNNSGAVSGAGVGSFFTDLRWNYPAQILSYSSSLHLTAPTGGTSKGLSTGHATWNFSNRFEHAFGDFSLFLDAGAGNTVVETLLFHRPFTSFGYDAQFDGGLEYNRGKFSFSAAAYDVAPWGNQTVISRVFRCRSGAKCRADGATRNRKSFTDTSVSTGAADLVRDNGYNLGINYKPSSSLDLEFGYSRSVPLQLDTFSFGIEMDLSRLLRPRAR